MLAIDKHSALFGLGSPQTYLEPCHATEKSSNTHNTLMSYESALRQVIYSNHVFFWCHPEGYARPLSVFWCEEDDTIFQVEQFE